MFICLPGGSVCLGGEPDSTPKRMPSAKCSPPKGMSMGIAKRRAARAELSRASGWGLEQEAAKTAWAKRAGDRFSFPKRSVGPTGSGGSTGPTGPTGPTRPKESSTTRVLWSAEGLRVAKGGRALLSIDRFFLPDVGLSVVVGPNGSGKSTLLKAMMGWAGRPAPLVGGCSSAALAARGKIAFLSQKERHDLPLTLLQYALLGLYPGLGPFSRPTRADTDKARELLNDFELGGLADKRVETLSGGEKQRASIVRVLLQGAPLALLDEPTNHLDVRHRCLLMGAIDKEKAKTRFVVVLHDLGLAADHADHVLLLKGGRPIAQGSPLDVLTEENLEIAYGWKIKRINVEGKICFVS